MMYTELPIKVLIQNKMCWCCTGVRQCGGKKCPSKCKGGSTKCPSCVEFKLLNTTKPVWNCSTKAEIAGDSSTNTVTNQQYFEDCWSLCSGAWCRFLMESLAKREQTAQTKLRMIVDTQNWATTLQLYTKHRVSSHLNLHNIQRVSRRALSLQLYTKRS